MRFLLLLFVAMAGAPAYSCTGDLAAELKAMRKAQNALMGSLVENHEAFARSIEENSSEGGSSAGLEKTASAFRQRGVSAKQTAAKLDIATGDLIRRIEICLKQGK